MKTIGLIGGMSWESTVTYYQIINRAAAARLGDLHSAKCVLYSVDFDEIERCQTAGDWARAGALLADAGCALRRAGADFLVLCTNTMHKVAPQIEAAAGIPLLHIADATADALAEQSVTRVGLLGTKYTMGLDFYKARLAARGFEVLLPDEDEQALVNRVIFGELCRGVISDESRRAYLRVIDGLAVRGAQGVILGCTEIGLLVRQANTGTPLFDTTAIHAQRAAARALSDENDL